MRGPHLSVFAALVLAGCGYVGDPLPPALNIPAPVAGLAAVQRGPDFVITFTAPDLTTENLTLTRISGIDLRINDKQIPDLPAPEPGKPARYELPAAEWSGQQVSVILRLSGPKGRYSPFSPALTVNAGPPLATPDVKVAPHPDGVRLSWTPHAGEQYRIFRDEAQIGVTGAGEYVDKTATLGKEYAYSVQAFIEKRESDLSKQLKVTARDEFPPAAPTGLTAVAGLKSIELTWDRNSEPDVATYRVYRAAANSNDFAVLADALNATAFSDRQVESGTTYKYRVTATDRSGNESDPSKVLEIKAP